MPEIRQCRELSVRGVSIMGVFSLQLETLSLADYFGSCAYRFNGLSHAGAGRFACRLPFSRTFLEWRVISKLRYRGICRSFDNMIKGLRASLLYDFRMSVNTDFAL